jgi:hypothetical protein
MNLYPYTHPSLGSSCLFLTTSAEIFEEIKLDVRLRLIVEKQVQGAEDIGFAGVVGTHQNVDVATLSQRN